MNRKTKPHTRAIVTGGTTKSHSPAGFDEVLALIEATRSRVVTAVNTALIDLYWRIGQYISRKIVEEGWGQGTVTVLAEYIRARRPNARGFSASNLWRMMQFYETYRGLPKLAPLVRVLSWTHNLLIMSRSKRDEEREFHLRLCVQEQWSKRQLKRPLAGALFERVALSPAKLSPPVREPHPEAASVFKDRYLVEFLDLPKDHSEADLHDGLVAKLKDFLILGPPEASADPLDNEIALGFRDSRHDHNNCAAERTAGIEVFSERHELNAEMA